jgi:hypothetical protein
MTRYGGRRRQSGAGTNSAESQRVAKLSPIVEPIAASQALGGHLGVVNNRSNAGGDKKYVDDQLAAIWVCIALITADTTGGREPRVVGDEVGYPPSTFTPVFEVQPGGLFGLVSGWEEGGMETLLPFLSVRSPQTEKERRTMVVYAWGPLDDIGRVEAMVLKRFDPACYTQSLGPDLGDGVVRFFVQVELFPDELAMALGISPDSPELEEIIRNQEAQARPAIDQPAAAGAVEGGAGRGWFRARRD